MTDNSVTVYRIVCRLLVALLAFPLWAGAQDPLVLGMFAYRPKATLEHKFAPLAAYLSDALGGRPVRLELLTQPEMEDALRNQRLDFVFTNPSHFILIRHDYRMSGAMATLVSRENGQATAYLGGVIITQPGRRDIPDLHSLRGLTIAISGAKYLGGYQTQAFELVEAGLRMPEDVRLTESGSHDAVIRDVLEGRVDAGFIRTGIIEELTREGTLAPEAVQVIHPQSVPHFPYITSTRLYPEWAFAASPRVPEAVVKEVARALLAIRPDMPAAQAAGIEGFTIPGDYTTVEELARRLRLPPFQYGPRIEIEDIWAQYRWPIVFGMLSLLIIAGLIIRLDGARRQIAAEHRQLLFAQAEHRVVLDLLGEGVFGIDGDGRCTFANPAALDLLGYRSDELLGKDAHQLFHHRRSDGQPFPVDECPVNQTAVDGIPRQGDDVFWHRDGRAIPVYLNIRPLMRDGVVDGTVVAFHNIQSRIDAMRQLEEQATHDALTGLPNRRYFNQRLAQEAARAERSKASAVVLMMDLDHFKRLNDAYGHAAGDMVLQQIAAVLRARLRLSDVPARLGGEEFAVLLPDTALEQGIEVAQSLCVAVAQQPILFADKLLTITASIGVASLNPDVPPDAALAHADAALYRAKSAGRDRVEVAMP